MPSQAQTASSTSPERQNTRIKRERSEESAESSNATQNIQRKRQKGDDDEESPAPIPTALKGKAKETVAEEISESSTSHINHALSSPLSSAPTVSHTTFDDRAQTLNPANGPSSPPTTEESGSKSIKPPDRQVELLKMELASKNELLEKHQNTFASVQGMLTCQICLELFADPYTSVCLLRL